MIDTIFFDMGNTLLDFHKFKSDISLERDGLNRVLRHLRTYNEKIDYDGVKKNFYDRWMDFMPRRSSELTEFSVENLLNEYLSEFGVTLDKSECINIMDIFNAKYSELISIEENALSTLEELKKRDFKIGIISNCRVFDENMIKIFNETKLDQFIDTYTFSYYLKVRKPKKEIFLEALKRTESFAMNSIMVGDLLHVDIDGAHGVGMKGVWYNKNSLSNSTEITPEYEITCLKELLDLKILKRR